MTGFLVARGMPGCSRPWVCRSTWSRKWRQRLVARHGFAYLDIALYHPPVYRFLEMRQELGVRNVFHPIARLLNPARASSQVVGLSHPPHFEKTAEVLRMLGCLRALVVSGVEGDPELSIAMPSQGFWNCETSGLRPSRLRQKMPDCRWVRRATWRAFRRISETKKRICSDGFSTISCRAGPQLGVDERGADSLCRRQRGTWASCIPLARRALEEGAAARKLEELTQEPVGTGVTGRTH